MLESLSATERIAFVLHDVFGYAFDEVAAALGTSPAAARQHASRARKAVEARRPRFPATPEQQREVDRRVRPGRARGRHATALLEMLHPDVVFTSDGGGIVTAARKPIEGADRVARRSKALTAKGDGAARRRARRRQRDAVLGIGRDGWTASFTGERIVAIDVQRTGLRRRRRGRRG